MEILGALEELHSQGLLHRNVRAAHFAIYPDYELPSTGQLKMLDLSEARPFVDAHGVVRQARGGAGSHRFTSRVHEDFASINIHEGYDKGTSYTDMHFTSFFFRGICLRKGCWLISSHCPPLTHPI
jgi:hypothetical protein